MGLLEDWKAKAYNQNEDPNRLKKFWDDYFLIEKGIYEKLLEHPDDAEEGTVRELADRFSVDVMTMTGFLDGIQESLTVPNPIENDLR